MYVGLFVLAIITFMADIIKSIQSINFFLVAFGVFIGYTVVRGNIQAENAEGKKKVIRYLGITVGGIGLFVVMVHFFFERLGLL